MKIFGADQLPGRTVFTSEEKEYLHFSGTDYLGMGHNADFRRFLQAGTDKYGNHYGSSRNNSLRLTVYENTENQLAEFAGAPASLIVSSGMWAGQLVMKMIEVFTGPEVRYHYAPRVHPALWGNQYASGPMSWNEWAQSVVTIISESSSNTAHIICTDAIGSPWVEDFDFSIFEALPRRQNVWLIADDSHNIGVRGINGKGIFQTLHLQAKTRVLVVSSLNKALGIPGGVIFGDRDVLEILQNSPWFAGASPPAPAFIYALQQLLHGRCYETANAILSHNIEYFTKKIKGNDLFTFLPEYPVYCSKDVLLYNHLLQNGIMASCFSYPSPSDSPVTRLALTALHQKKDLDRLAEICINF